MTCEGERDADLYSRGISRRCQLTLINTEEVCTCTWLGMARNTSPRLKRILVQNQEKDIN